MEWLTRRALGSPRATLMLALAITALAAAGFPRIATEVGYRGVLGDTHPSVLELEAFIARFGGGLPVFAVYSCAESRACDSVFDDAPLRMAAWVVGAGEVWLALWLLGEPVPVLDAVAFEAIGQTARALGFAVPAGLGVQEGGYVLAGRALGISGEAALTVSLVRRGRELLLGVPGLVAWQVAEGRRWVAR